MLILFTSCATKIPFEQTCLNCISSQRISCNDCPQTIMVGTNCIATIDEIGEKINMNYILNKEEIAIAANIPLTLAKIRGRYFVTGANFKHLWVLTPVENQARVKKIPFPEEKSEMPPVFEIIGTNLLVKFPNNKVLEYDIDSKKWINLQTKAGG